MKKLLSLILAAAMLLGMTGLAAAEDAITIQYPENMQAQGYTEPVVLEKMPERVVCMSTSPVLALCNLGVKIIAAPSSSVVTWPESMADATLLQLAHNTNFDIETVVAMEPDLVILGSTSKDTYGAVLTDAGIPVYYVDAGHTVSYDSIKAQTVACSCQAKVDKQKEEAKRSPVRSCTELGFCSPGRRAAAGC